MKKIKKSFNNLRTKVFSKNKLKVLAYFLFVISLLLFVSFISFFFNWKIDSNNIYYNSWAEVISNKEIIIANSLGKIGALISHKFIFMWFGICAFTRVNNILKNRGFIVEEINFSKISKLGGLFRCSTLPLKRK